MKIERRAAIFAILGGLLRRNLMAERKVTNLLATKRTLEDANDLMQQLQQEINDIKLGNISESQARIVVQIRRQQCRVFEMTIQATRLERGLVGNLRKRFAAAPERQLPQPANEPKDEHTPEAPKERRGRGKNNI